ncbi:13177_t:CDS:1, partial [Gigaspora rosea]
MSSFRTGFKKIYFPNIIFRLMRTPTLPPNQVAFRVPPNINKLDIRDYLFHVYKLKVFDVRTMNYGAKRPIKKSDGILRGKFTSKYKKAIVTLAEDFAYPPPPDKSELEHYSNRAEIDRLRFRRLAGWKSRPQRLNMRIEMMKK